MGNSTLQPKLVELTFQQSLQDPHFGPVDIFRTHQGLFIMKLTRTTIEGDRHHSQFLKTIQLISAHPLPNIVPVMHLHQTEQKTLCIKYLKIEIYTEYYNYTLLDLANTRRELEECELWFILQTIMHLIVALQEHQIVFPVQLSKVFLTPSGIPYVYIYHLRSCKESLHYCEFSMSQQLAIMIMELALNIQLPLHSQQQLMPNHPLFVKMKTKYKLLGDVVDRIMKGEVNERQVLQLMGTLEEKELISIGSQVKLLKFKYNLPDKTIINPSILKASTTHPFQNKENKVNRTASKSKAKANIHNVLGESNRLFTEKSKMLQTQGKEARSSVHTNSSSKKPEANLLLTKETNLKELTSLQQKKQEYRVQLHRFEQRKQEMLRNQKEPILAARKSEKKKDTLPPQRKVNQRIHGRFR